MKSKRWTMEDIEQLAAAGRIKGWKDVTKKKKKQKVPKPVQDKPLALQKMEETLQKHGITYVTEYRFHPPRKFRFDIAVPSLMIAFEYEGLMSKKSRHTTVTGYTKDASKYNLAQGDGWHVFRYTILNHTEIEQDLLNILNKPS